MSERDAVLFANEAFYQAFTDRDMRAMDEVWANDVPVMCIHPGWQPLEGRDEVMRSWHSILSNPSSPEIRFREARVLLGTDMAVVVCYEEIQGQFLVATNVFVREGGPWRMVHHQAGPTGGVPQDDDEADDDNGGGRLVN